MLRVHDIRNISSYARRRTPTTPKDNDRTIVFFVGRQDERVSRLQPARRKARGGKRADLYTTGRVNTRTGRLRSERYTPYAHNVIAAINDITSSLPRHATGTAYRIPHTSIQPDAFRVPPTHCCGEPNSGAVGRYKNVQIWTYTLRCAGAATDSSRGIAPG